MAGNTNSRKSNAKSPHGRDSNQKGKVGDSLEAAQKVGGKGDFGVRESDPVERSYASAATRHQDKGGGVSHSGADGLRTSGVGGNESGVGSSSGGDVDTDIVGVGTGGSTVAASGLIGEAPGPDDVIEKSNRAKSRSRPGKGRNHGPAKLGAGSTVNHDGGDASTTGDGQGSAAVTNPEARNDDSFAAEISNDEAAGADNTASDNL